MEGDEGGVKALECILNERKAAKLCYFMLLLWTNTILEIIIHLKVRTGVRSYVWAPATSKVKSV